MNRAAMSILVWGIYLIGAGLGFLLMPNFVLALFRFSATSENWLRVLGRLVAIVGAYYFSAARNNVIPFFRMTVPGRFAFALGSLGLVLIGLSEPSLLIIGATDALGAVWTWLSLRSMAEMKSQGSIARA